MKLQVIHKNGVIEVLDLSGEWTVVNGETLDRLAQSGMEHYFTKDGYYDGWGGAVSVGLAEANDIIEGMEGKRTFLGTIDSISKLPANAGERQP